MPGKLILLRDHLSSQGISIQYKSGKIGLFQRSQREVTYFCIFTEVRHIPSAGYCFQKLNDKHNWVARMVVMGFCPFILCTGYRWRKTKEQQSWNNNKQIFPEQKAKKSFALCHLCPVHEVLSGTGNPLISEKTVNSFGHNLRSGPIWAVLIHSL